MTRLFLVLAGLLLSRVALASDASIERIATLSKAQFEGRLEEIGVAGLSVAAGDASGAVWARSYGFANIEAKRRLDEAETAFHVASVTKLITAIAIMQLAERGKLSLDDDVNRLVDGFKIPERWGAPVLVRHLLTHTAGFDVDYLDLATTDPKKVEPLGSYLKTHLPERIVQPGRRVIYSNHGFGVLGAVIERACNCTYAAYVQENIFDRLGLEQSAINVHPRARALRRATGYFYRERIIEEPELFEHMGAAGGALMSMGDLVKLVLALHDGRLVSLDSARAMQRVQFSHDPAMQGGYGFGFWHVPGYSTPVLLVGGDVPGFSTRVLYLPEFGFVASVAVNRKDAQPAEALFRGFLKPFKKGQATVASWRSGDAFAGEYRYAGFPRASFLKIGGLFGPKLLATGHPSGLQILLPNASERSLWRQRSPGLFERDGSGEILTIRRDSSDERWLYLDTFEAGPVAFERIPAYRATEVSLLGFALPVAMSILALLWAGLRSLLRRRALPALAVLSQTVLATFGILFAVGFYDLAIARDDRFAYEALPVILRVALALPWLGAPASLAYGVATAISFRGLSTGTKTAACALLLLQAWFWFEVWDWRLFMPAPWQATW